MTEEHMGHQLPSTAAAQGPSLEDRPAPVEGATHFDLGNVLSRGFGIWARNFVPLAVITLLCQAPWIVTNAMATRDLEAGRILSPMSLISMLLAFVAFPLATAACVYAVRGSLRGEHVSVGASLSAVLQRAFPVIGLSIVSSVLIALGTMACIVPGILLMTMWYVAMPTLIVDDVGIGAAMSRSGELTRGHRGEVLVLAILPYLINFAISIALNMVAAPMAVSTGISAVAGVVTGSLGAVFATLAFVDLRNEKEANTVGH